MNFKVDGINNFPLSPINHIVAPRTMNMITTAIKIVPDIDVLLLGEYQ
jgi:hypothetical protein